MKRSADILPFAGNPRPRETKAESALLLILPVVRIESADDMEAPRHRRRRRPKKAAEGLLRDKVLKSLSQANAGFLADAIKETQEKWMADIERMIAESFGLSLDDVRRL